MEADSVEGLPGPGNGPVGGSMLAPDNALSGSAWCSLTRSPAAASGLSGGCVGSPHYPEGLRVYARRISLVKPLYGSCYHHPYFSQDTTKTQRGAATAPSVPVYFS